MMRITLIGPVFPYRGGIAHFTSQLADKLRTEENVNLQVISYHRQYPKWLYPGESDRDDSEGRLKVNAVFSLSPLNPFSWLKTIRLIRNFRPALVIFPWWVTFWGPCYLALFAGLKSIRKMLLVHNVIPHEPRFFDPWLTRSVLSRADAHLLMSEGEKKRLLDLVPNSKPAVIPHPIYSVFAPVELTRAQARQRLDLPADAPLLLFFGIVRPYKGLEDLLQALGRIRARGRLVRLLVAGEIWEDRQRYEKIMNDLGISEQVHFTGRYIPDHEVGIAFKAADLFIAPYRSGTQSGAIAAALGFGLPIVLTDVIADPLARSLPDLCEIVPAAEPGLLAAAIENSLDRNPLSDEQIEVLVEKSWRDFTGLILRKTESAGTA